jgi:nucleoside permease NupC
MLIHGFDSTANANIEALRTLYKKRFGQESVMRVGWKLVYGSTLVSLLSAAFAGLFI